MPKQDKTTSSEVFLSLDHSEINMGQMFGVPAVASALAAAGTYKVGFTTPAATTGKYVHVLPATLSSTANLASLTLYEGSVYSSGTSVIPVARNRNSSNYARTTFSIGATAALTGTVVVNAKAGGNFANQPAGDAIEVLSDNAADVGMTCTIYGTKTGATTTVTSETVVLDGTNVATTATTTWQNILGVELSASCAGTVTIREASGNQAVTTILTTVLSAGVETPSSIYARNQVVRHDASGAATTPVGIIGTDYKGAALSSVDALNGTTEEDHNADIFNTVTKVLIGAVASTVQVTILYPEKIIDQIGVGTGQTSARVATSENKIVLLPDTMYVYVLANVGSSTATNINAGILFYEDIA